MAARRIAIGNHKGGSGKTTTTVRLGEALARAGNRVLVVDLDAQGNASRRLGWSQDPAAPRHTISDAILVGQPGAAAGCVYPVGWQTPLAERMQIAPATAALANREKEGSEMGAALRLADALAGVDDDVDYTLIDTPPSLGHLAQLALAAAHVAVAVAEPEHDGIEGAVRYRDFVGRAGRALGNPHLRWGGVILNAVDGRLAAHTGQAAAARETLFAGEVWDPAIPSRSAIITADEHARHLGPGTGETAMMASYDLLAQYATKVIG